MRGVGEEHCISNLVRVNVVEILAVDAEEVLRDLGVVGVFIDEEAFAADAKVDRLGALEDVNVAFMLGWTTKDELRSLGFFSGVEVGIGC